MSVSARSPTATEKKGPGEGPGLSGRLLKVQDVMARLDCSRSTVHRRIADGSILVVRIKGLVRFRAETIEALVEVAEAGTPHLFGEE
ncbi:MAG: helix-turn-helix domain-containing protein [Myxococcaceae bacterium]